VDACSCAISRFASRTWRLGTVASRTWRLSTVASHTWRLSTVASRTWRLAHLVRARREVAERLDAAALREPPAEPSEQVAEVEAELEERPHRRVRVVAHERGRQPAEEAREVARHLLRAADRDPHALVDPVRRIALAEERGAVAVLRVELHEAAERRPVPVAPSAPGRRRAPTRRAACATRVEVAPEKSVGSKRPTRSDDPAVRGVRGLRERSAGRVKAFAASRTRSSTWKRSTASCLRRLDAPGRTARVVVGERRDERARPPAVGDAVGVGEAEDGAARLGEAGVARRVRALHPALRDDPHRVVAHDRHRAVGRAVVDRDDLEPVGRIVLREERGETAADRALGVERGDDDADERQTHADASSTGTGTCRRRSPTMRR
jgi:hypothetical protein